MYRRGTKRYYQEGVVLLNIQHISLSHNIVTRKQSQSRVSDIRVEVMRNQATSVVFISPPNTFTDPGAVDIIVALYATASKYGPAEEVTDREAVIGGGLG